MRMIEAGAPHQPGRAGSRVVDGVAGCAMLIAREVFERIGLFDEEYFFSFEDLDFCLRARRAGFASVCVLDAVAYHHGSRSIGPRSPQRLYFAARNHLLLAKRAAPQVAVVAAARASWIVALNLAFALRGEASPRAAGVLQVLRGVGHHLHRPLPIGSGERRRGSEPRRSSTGHERSRIAADPRSERRTLRAAPHAGARRSSPAADVVAAPGGFEVRGTAPLIVAAPASGPQPSGWVVLEHDAGAPFTLLFDQGRGLDRPGRCRVARGEQRPRPPPDRPSRLVAAAAPRARRQSTGRFRAHQLGRRTSSAPGRSSSSCSTGAGARDGLRGAIERLSRALRKRDRGPGSVLIQAVSTPAARVRARAGAACPP